jgi:hypothetical protein
LVLDWRSVDVILSIGRTTSIELAATVVLDAAFGRDRKACSWDGAYITLPLLNTALAYVAPLQKGVHCSYLGSRRCQDTPPSIGIGDTAIVDAVSRWSIATADTVLSITELANGTRFSSGSGDLEAAAVASRQDERGSSTGESQCNDL